MCTVTSEISRLFADMSLTAALLTAVGFTLIAVEFFQPTRSVAAVAGVIAAVSGIVARMLTAGTEGTLFLMLIGFAFCVYAAHAVMLAAFKRDWLLQSAYLKVSHVDIDRPLTGISGAAQTDFDGYGRVTAEGLDLFVFCGRPLKAGDKVMVERVSGDKIYVRPAECAEKNVTSQ